MQITRALMMTRIYGKPHYFRLRTRYGWQWMVQLTIVNEPSVDYFSEHLNGRDLEAQIRLEDQRWVSKRGRGRPVAEKPWEAAGISRQAWYKRGNRKKGEQP